VPSCDLCLRADALPALVRHFLPRDARRALHALGKANPTCTLPTLRDPTYALALRVPRVACGGSDCGCGAHGCWHGRRTLLWWATVEAERMRLGAVGVELS